MEPLRDCNGHALESGFYVFLSPLSPEIYYLNVSDDKRSFSVEGRLGYESNINFEEAAKNLVAFAGVDTTASNARFVLSKLEKLYETSKKT